jgi:hypothetical protein
MAWVTVTSGFGSAGVKGTDGDGKITAAIGLVAGLLALFGLTKGNRGNVVLAGLLSLGGAAMTLYEWRNLSSKIDELGSNDFVRATVGTGIWVMLSGFVVATICLFQAVPADTHDVH